MKIDAKEIQGGSKIETDVCIIGAGAAGISIANEFVNQNTKVVLLESGGYEYEQSTQDLYQGDVVGRDYFSLALTRLRYFGGSTNHWGGMCAPMTDSDFQKHSWIPFSGWPFDYSELEKYYKRAHKVCDLGPYDYSSAHWESVLASPIFPIDPALFSSGVMQYSPPTRFGVKYRDVIEKSENIKLIINANALELEVNKAVNKVSSVKVSSLLRNSFNVSAKLFIVATGGLENARLLLLSNSVQKTGLGNENGLVGKYFMEHPHWSCGKILLEDSATDVSYYDSVATRRVPGIRAAGIVYPTSHLLKREKLLNALFHLEPVYMDESDNFSEKASDFIDHVGQVIRKKGYIDYDTYKTFLSKQKMVKHIDLFSTNEQAPTLESQVRLSHKKDYFDQNKMELDWVLSSVEKPDFMRLLELLAREIGKSKIGRLQIDLQTQPGWPGGNHHMGTTRMDSNPKLGVVDKQCRIHGVDNLYVAGSSVFATAGAVNPTLTIVALALRLAAHLKENVL